MNIDADQLKQLVLADLVFCKKKLSKRGVQKKSGIDCTGHQTVLPFYQYVILVLPQQSNQK